MGGAKYGGSYQDGEEDSGAEGEKKVRPWADLGEARGEREGVDRDGRGEGCRVEQVDVKGGSATFFLLSYSRAWAGAGAGRGGEGELAGGDGRDGGGGVWLGCPLWQREKERGRLGLARVEGWVARARLGTRVG